MLLYSCNYTKFYIKLARAIVPILIREYANMELELIVRINSAKSCLSEPNYMTLLDD